MVFFVAGLPKTFVDFLAAKARTKIGGGLQLIASGRFDFCWIVDFLMFEERGRGEDRLLKANPFSMPQGGLEALDTMELEDHGLPA